MVLVLLNKAIMIASNERMSISTSNKSFLLPSIIKLNYFVQRPYKKVYLTRKNVLRRDNFKCAYCGRSDLQLTIDHIEPKSRGGLDEWENLITACIKCNNKKGDRTPEEAEMNLRFKPFKPTHLTFLINSCGRINEQWKPYLFVK
ncbi:MAG TPA: HNH endonuclease [Melioribacteraceae bacterium]|nr:HNH endonuclease [Melioribacteraceae bacterium]